MDMNLLRLMIRLEEMTYDIMK